MSRARTVVGVGCGLATVMVAALAASSSDAPPFLINESGSVPRGLYRHLPNRTPERGAVVAFSQPRLSRDYLRALGAPSDMPLIKRVVAGQGEAICVSDGGAEWPGGRVPVPTHDRGGRALPSWRGCGRLSAGWLFLAGDTPTSFDSRYFGPIASTEIIGVYERVLSW